MDNKKITTSKVLLKAALVFVLFSVGGSIVYAQQDPQSLQGGIDEAKKVDTTLAKVAGRSPLTFLGDVINYLLEIVAVLALLALVVGAIMYIISLGNDQRVETAKKIIMSAIIGLILVGAAFFIINTVQELIIGPQA